MNVLDDLIDFLAAAGLGLTHGTNLFTGPIKARSTVVPVDAVFATGAGGPPPERAMGQIEETRRAVISLQIRWSTQEAGDAKIRSIQNALQGISVSGYLDISSLESEPTLIGRDPEGYYIFLLNIQMIYNEVA